MKVRHIPDRARYEQMGTQAIRSHYLIENLFEANEIVLHYLDLDRAIVGSAVPVSDALILPSPTELRADFFTQRRELGVMNVGGTGNVIVEDKPHLLAYRDALYIGRGSKEIIFESSDSSSPAKFYLISYPAHAAYSTTVSKVANAEPMELGSEASSNKRTIYKHIHTNGIQSAQLVMGFTELAEGSVWNTMPAHKHLRRSEIYLYFNLADEAVVFHLMGPPEETRHIAVRNGQAVISPGWSIHAGAGTTNYGFIWAMGGENQDYTDMDPVAVNELR